MRHHFISEDEFKVIEQRVKGSTEGRAGGSVSRPVGVTRSVTSPRGNCESVSNPAPSPYRSKLEAAFAGKLELERKAG